MWWLVPSLGVLSGGGQFRYIPRACDGGGCSLQPHLGRWWWGSSQPLLASAEWWLAEFVQSVSCPLGIQVQTKEKRLQFAPCPPPHMPPKQWSVVSKAAQAPLAYMVACMVALDSSPSHLSPHSNPSSLLGYDLQSLNLSTQPPSELMDVHVRLGSAEGWYWLTVQYSLCSGCHKLATVLSFKVLKFPFCSGWFPTSEGASQGSEHCCILAIWTSASNFQNLSFYSPIKWWAL